MASREVSLYLKYPGPPVALQRLQHSYLECVIEYKSGSVGELQTLPPAQLRSHYQLKGTTTLVDDELLVQFVPKHAGLHTVRIFGDTRELCRPVAFIINQNCEVESTPYDKPVKTTSSFFQSSSQEPTTRLPHEQVGIQPHMSRVPSHYPSRVVDTDTQHLQQPFSSFQSVPSATEQYAVDGLDRDILPEPSVDYCEPTSLQTSPQHLGSPSNQQRYSYLSSGAINSRPTSFSAADEAAFAGDLLTTKPDRNTFNQLYTAKVSGQPVYGKRRPFMAVDHESMMTPDTFRYLEKDIDYVVSRGQSKRKKRCTICSNKIKTSKMVDLCEQSFCESCFRRQFLLRSAIDHFMIPSIEECTIEVPVNRKATKFVPARKTLPNVNLRGLAPSEVKYALQEFRKFSTDDNGWINKAILFPLMKACFTYSLTDREIKSLLFSQALQSLIKNFGISDREEVHEIEFLSLVAFVARERQRVQASTDPKNKFTGADLQMAYAFRDHFGIQGETSARNPQARSGPGPTDRFRTSSAPPQSQFSQVQLRNRGSTMQRQQQRETHLMQGSTASQVGQRSSLIRSQPNPNLLPGGSQSVLGLPTSPTSTQQNPLGFRSQPHSQYDFTQLQHPNPVPAAFSGTSAFSDSVNLSSLQPADGGFRGVMGDLPEEDQEENELPTIPQNKDPAGQTITNPLLSKRPPNSKQMLEELKLTGGSADSWMLY